MSDMVEKVARAIEPMMADIADMLIAKGAPRERALEILPMAKARDAIEATERGWRSMDSAPTDGTVIEVAGRYPTATAGFPQYVGFRDGKWWRHSRNAPEEIIPWAWRPRTDWPDEGALSETGER